MHVDLHVLRSTWASQSRLKNYDYDLAYCIWSEDPHGFILTVYCWSHSSPTVIQPKCPPVVAGLSCGPFWLVVWASWRSWRRRGRRCPPGARVWDGNRQRSQEKKKKKKKDFCSHRVTSLRSSGPDLLSNANGIKRKCRWEWAILWLIY